MDSANDNNLACKREFTLCTSHFKDLVVDF